MTTRATGIGLALTTALISGVSIYVSGHAVQHFSDATVYTTAKNAVAGILLTVLALTLWRPREPRPRERPAPGRSAVALLALAAVGGSVPFVLFFEGLARAEATQASFIHKTLVVWVVLLAVPLLRERLRPPHVLAIGLILGGQVWLSGSLGTVAFGPGEAMILGATLLWAVEVVYVKRLLGALRFHPSTLAAARLGLGTLLLLAWLGITGGLGGLEALDGAQWRWAVLTGLLLTGYVATWYAALARAQAVDVTAALVLGAPVTAILAGTIDGRSVGIGGTALIVLGVAIVSWIALRRPRARPDAA